jgi:NAD(P)H-dependent FMN reductase
VWHSRTGGSRALAEAAAAGARAVGTVPVALIPACDAEDDDMLAASAYLFVAPENLAGLSGAMKEFFDRAYYPCLDRIEGRAYASIICAGSDGSGAERQIDRIATGWRLKRAAPGMIVGTNAQAAEAILADKVIDAADLAAARDLGAALAEGLALGVY